MACAVVQAFGQFLLHVGIDDCRDLALRIQEAEADAPHMTVAEAGDDVVAAVVMGAVDGCGHGRIVTAELAQGPFPAQGIPGGEVDLAAVEPWVFYGEVIGSELGQGAAETVTGDVDAAGCFK